MTRDDENVRLEQTRGYNRHMKAYKSSQAFRHPIDAKGSKILTSPDRIDLRNLKNVMGRVANFLDDTSSAIGEMNLDSE